MTTKQNKSLPNRKLRQLAARLEAELWHRVWSGQFSPVKFQRKIK